MTERFVHGPYRRISKQSRAPPHTMSAFARRDPPLLFPGQTFMPAPATSPPCRY